MQMTSARVTTWTMHSCRSARRADASAALAARAMGDVKALFDDDSSGSECEDWGRRKARAEAAGGKRRRRGNDGRAASSEDEDAAGGVDDVDGFRVNAAYAARFEHNERRKEMHRLEARLAREVAARALRGDDGGGSGESEMESETESEDEEVLENAFDGAFAEALTRIRRKDPSIYDEKTTFFAEEDEGEAEDGGRKTRKKSVEMATLREVTAKQLLEGGATALEDAEMEAEAMARRVETGPSYVEEQAALKRAFKDAAEGASDSDGDDDGGLVMKQRAEAMTAATEKMSQYFGDDRALTAEDKFLRDYVLEKQWLKDDEKTKNVIGGDSGDDDDDADDDSASDSELLERAEEFEHKYNFRFEEPGGDKLVSHSRHIEGLIRREDTKRRDKRKKVKERKESERAKLLAEVRRLKNLKREEIDSKMRQIRAIGGLSASRLKDDLLNTEFDPAAHDKVMAEMYNDDYYHDEEAANVAKPEFGDLEEELADMLGREAEPFDDEDDEDEDADEEMQTNEDYDQGEEDDENAPLVEEAQQQGDTENKFSKRAAKKWRKELEKKMEEYYKLDAEDFIGGDLPTRFKYKEVAPKMFGLTTRDILLMDDKSLNQIVGLKKLAPYRDDADDATVTANQRAKARRMAREFYAKQKERNARGASKKRKSGGPSADEDSESDSAEDRAKSYADAAFGKKTSAKSSKTTDDEMRPLVDGSSKGKNARKNAKKRAKKKAANGETKG